MIDFNQQNLPKNTRFLYKDFYGLLCDGIIYEWSPSQKYVDVSGTWYNVDTEINCHLSRRKFTIIEILKQC
jgi:hypothetical protein